MIMDPSSPRRPDIRLPGRPPYTLLLQQRIYRVGLRTLAERGRRGAAVLISIEQPVDTSSFVQT